jgi:hypothetical protein
MGYHQVCGSSDSHDRLELLLPARGRNRDHQFPDELGGSPIYKVVTDETAAKITEG